jgi:hypothetical protein
MEATKRRGIKTIQIWGPSKIGGENMLCIGTYAALPHGALHQIRRLHLRFL